ncbi:MAG: phosphatidate cytidylyltransferase [Mesorhizobium amorphae]|nr:MAG: phosphatidate cytidylyltransferase [Mesorhizobium amorphae]
MNTETILLFAGLLGVLTLASTVSGILSARAGTPSPVLQNLSERIKAWWAMAALLALAVALGPKGVIVLFALVSFAAMREFMTLSNTRRADHWVLLAMFGVVLPVQYWLVWTNWYGLFAVFVPVWCFLFMPALTVLRGDTENFLFRVSEQQWGVMATVYCLSHVAALATLPIPGFEGRQVLLVAFLLVVVQGSDVLQYIAGKLFGRTKMAPAVSPSKTWEGLVGGLGGATLLGAGLWWLTPFSPWQAALVALAACLMGTIGGLVASAIKRDRGVKDWGSLIEGHGGMMDRVDSLVFAAPVFFHLVRYNWV